MLRVWLTDYQPGCVLFPKLGRRRTWLMVKKDLERVGIDYVTSEGIADFHAAGRHTHITELLRNGASLPEAKGLARHSDIKMTMRYAHTGIADQAKALQQLPWQPSENARGEPVEATALEAGSAAGRKRPGSESGVAECQSGALGGTACAPTPSSATPVADRGCRKKSPSGSDGQEWRRRGSNPPLKCRKDLQHSDLRKCEIVQSANVSHSSGPEWHDASSSDAMLHHLNKLWSALPTLVQQAIVTLADASRHTQTKSGDVRVE